jgi:hypothetical protein
VQVKGTTPLPALTTPSKTGSQPHPFQGMLVGEEEVTEAKKKKKRSLRNPEDNPCWDGYEPVGLKKLKGKMVPNCVPKDK